MRQYLKLQEAKEKYGENNVRKIFEILIEGRMYPVYGIEGYEHMLGQSNGCPASWWLDYSVYHTDDDDEEPTMRELVPYIDKGVHRICWGVNYRQYNSTKYKWDEWNIRSGGVCEITANNKPVYKFHWRDFEGALAVAQVKINDMIGHPFNFIYPEKEVGRKIWYYGLPAKILLGYEPGEIRIDPDFSYLSPQEWWDKLEERKSNVYPKDEKLDDDEELDRDLDKEYFDDSKHYGSINHGDAFYDKMIGWFRK